MLDLVKVSSQSRHKASAKNQSRFKKLADITVLYEQ